jgi:UDP-N-acetyl-D-mannosaminuronic acid dehydrogenase
VTNNLFQMIGNKTAKVVVLGLGYVGLPVSCLFAEAGFPMVGLERRQDKVDMINQGQSPIEGKEPGLAELVSQVVSQGKLHVTTDYYACADAQIILIAVETPVDSETKKPNYQALRSALAELGQYLSPKTLVIIESTLVPGTMAYIVKPILEETSGLQANQDFYLVHCPERLMPGKLLANIRDCDRVVGGMNPEAAELAVNFYRHVVQGSLDATDALTAELVKTMENAYRDVQIAFANEMALLCEDLGADVWRIRELVNKSPHRNMHLPGAGVGGHCIPKDPWLLITNISHRFKPRLIPTARAVNDSMPEHMGELTLEALAEAGLNPKQSRVLVLGYAYLENSDDTRNSPSEVLVRSLTPQVGKIVVHDPWVPEYQGNPLKLAAGCDIVVLMVKHQAYYELDLAVLKTLLRTPILVDGRHVFNGSEVRAAGFSYYGLGQGTKMRNTNHQAHLLPAVEIPA